jgi:GAF domain-containing protein
MRRPFQIDDLHALASAAAAAAEPPPVYAALEALAGQVIGHRLFTIMRFDAARFEVVRVHTNMPDVYPVGGRKQKAHNAWGDRVLVDMQIVRASNANEIRGSFEDHATIIGLGLGSILNVPIVAGGRCVGTMNLCHEEGWYTAGDERTAMLLGSFLAASLLALRC